MADPDVAEPDPSDPPAPPPAGEPPRHLLVYVDGASSGNPGPCGAACVVKMPDGEPVGAKFAHTLKADGETVLDRARAFGPATNNVAEYQALLLGLETAAQLRPRRLTIRSDSQLLVRQLAGRYKVRSPLLKPLHRQARAMLEPFETVEIEHIGREMNKEADALARKALEKSREVDADLLPGGPQTCPAEVVPPEVAAGPCPADGVGAARPRRMIPPRPSAAYVPISRIASRMCSR